MLRHSTLLSLCVLLLSGCMPGIPKDALKLSPESLAERQLQTRRFETVNHQAMLSAASAVFQDLGFSLDESEYTLGVLVGSKHRDATSGAQIAGAVVLAALTGAVTHVDRDQIIRASMVMREIESPNENGKPAESQRLSPEKIDSIKTNVSKAVADGLKDRFPGEVSRKIAAKIADDTATTLTDELTTLMQVRSGSGSSTVRVTFQRVIYNTAGQVTTTEQIKDPVVYRQFFDKLAQAVFLEAHEI